MVRSKTKRWYFLLTLLIMTALIYFGMVRPYIPLSQGAPIDPKYINMNQYAGQKIPPGRYYASLWGDMDFIEGFLCLFLGLICAVLGIIRAFNKLNCRQILLIAIFSMLFSMMSLSMTDFASQYFKPEFLFYIFWLTFFGYPIALFLHFFDCLSTFWRHWLWPVVFVIIGYSAAALIMYFGFRLPFDVPERLYTQISIISTLIYLAIGTFGAKDKETTLYMRVISAIGIVFALIMIIKTWRGLDYSFHNYYKLCFLCVVVFMTCYMLFINTSELVHYRTGMQMMELRNEFMLENYQELEKHQAHVAQMKHEIRHHMLALHGLCENGEYERLSHYLSHVQDSLAEVKEPVACGNRVIQAVLSHAAGRAQAMGFDIDFEIMPLPPLFMPDADLVSLFMNLLDNALESCAHIQNPQRRWIKVRIKAPASYLCLSVANARQGEINKLGTAYKSTKNNSMFHGHGIGVVRKITEKHGGLASFEHTQDTFCAEVALPLT